MATQPSNAQTVFLATGDAMTVLAERTAQVDRAVMNTAATGLLPAIPSGLALVAVGGYGRRQLFPHSDIDLLLLVEQERVEQSQKDAISAFLQRLWDSGLRMSHSVRTPEECAEVHDTNAELNVSLLDQRYLAGDRVLYADLARRMPRFVAGNREALVRNLAQLTRDRHAKYANTIYHLEPNIKETPGGLRDYQLVCWLEEIAAAGGGRMRAAEPAPELQESMRFLARLRCYLHVQSGRDNNILSFEAQDALADQWQQSDPAQWMRQYYRHSRAIFRAALRHLEAHEAQSSSLLAQFRDWRSRLANSDFSVHRDRAHFRSPQHLEVEPELVLGMFEFVARHGILLSAEAEQQIEARLAGLRAHFRTPQPVWPVLNRIFSLPHAPLAARQMHETGVLSAIFPEMELIECLVVRDFFHRYTVDEHSLVAIETLWRLAPPYRDLLAEVKEPGVVVFALLFHDTGKGLPHEGHVDGSLRLAAAAMERIGMPPQERDMARFLIGRHLDLSAAMQSRDVFDPPTIHDVARQVATVERLKALTLVTFADISAVNPTVMTPWRAQQLWQLYLMVYNELTRELVSDRIEAAPFGPERAAFVEGFPTRYLRTHTDAEMEAHMALRDKSRARGVSVDVERVDSAWRLTLVAADRAGLFASVAGTLSSFGMNILKAEAFANRRGLVLDTFTFADPHRTLELNPSEVDRLRTAAEKVILHKTDVRELLRNRPKPKLPSRKAGIQTRVSFDSDAGATATLVEIVAQDRPGLLYDLASAISLNGCNIEVVLIDTQAHKAIDVFYVTAEGKKLEAGKIEVLKGALERACEAG